jgi:NADPH2:quinone reductase
VGGAQFTAALRACNPEARLIVIGFASGEVPQIKANHLLVKNVSVIGHYWGGYMAFRPEVVTGSLKTLFGWYGDGRLTPHVSHVSAACRGGGGAGTAAEPEIDRQGGDRDLRPAGRPGAYQSAP